MQTAVVIPENNLEMTSEVKMEWKTWMDEVTRAGISFQSPE